METVSSLQTGRPLSKTLWLGKQTVDGIFFEQADYYAGSGVDLVLDTEAVRVGRG